MAAHQLSPLRLNLTAVPFGKSRHRTETFQPTAFAPSANRAARDEAEQLQLHVFLAGPDADHVSLAAVGAA